MINHPKKDIIQIAVRPGFVLIPRELFTLDLSSNEFRIYIVLLTYEDRRTHTCYPSLSTLAKAARVTKKTAMKCVHCWKKNGCLKSGTQKCLQKMALF